MKKFNVRVMLLLVLFIAGIVSCKHVTIYDKQVCADLGYAGAECAYTYTEGRESVSKRDWDKKRVGWFCMSVDDYSDTEDSIEQLCTTSNLCDYETKALIERAKKNLSPLVQQSLLIKSENK